MENTAEWYEKQAIRCADSPAQVVNQLALVYATLAQAAATSELVELIGRNVYDDGVEVKGRLTVTSYDGNAI